MSEFMKLTDGVKLTQVTQGPEQHFFGYYDVCPWNQSGEQIICLATKVPLRVPRSGDMAVVGIIDSEGEHVYRAIAETSAWNWQQGAMAQWLPPNYNEYVIYNDIARNHFIAVIKNIRTGERIELPHPIYTISSDGKYALSVNQSRLYRLAPGYGYAGIQDAYEHDPVPVKDGITLINLSTGTAERILSISEVAAFERPNDAVSLLGQHWVAHLSFTPDGERFAFLHRFTLPGGGFQTRLLTSDLQGANLHLLGSGMISHYSWYNNQQIVAWARKPRLMTRLQGLSWAWRLLKWGRSLTRRFTTGWIRQSIVGDAYILFTDGSRETETLAEGVLVTDGHCSFSPDKRWLLTDTYPDVKRYQTLVLYDMAAEKRLDVARFFSPIEFSGFVRCDLHPRWDHKGLEVCVDSASDGSRQIYTLELGELIGG